MAFFRRSDLLAVGSPAPSYRLSDQSGTTHGFSDYHGKVVVLFFYPRDDTPGCRIEARGFRDQHSQFTANDVVILGCSMDGVESHRRWAEKEGLQFPLLADPDGIMAQAFGVHRGIGPLLQRAARVTFIIDRDGRIAAVLDGVTPRGHPDQVLKKLGDLGLLSPAQGG